MWSNHLILIVFDFSNYGKARERIKTVPYLILAGNGTLAVPPDRNWTDFNPLFFLADFLL